MATPPTFSSGQVLTAAQMNLVGLWRISSATVTSVGGTAATASNGYITVGTGNTSITVSDAFSADYHAYRISFEAVDFSNSAATVQLTFGAAAAAYYSTTRYDNYDGTSNGFTRVNNGAYILIGYSSQNDDFNCEVTVVNPYASKRTAVMSQYSSDKYSGWGNGQLATTTSYTAFTIVPGAGSMTGGNIIIYGYRF